MSNGVRTIVQLKLQRRIILEQLKDTDEKFELIQEIVKKKQASKLSTSEKNMTPEQLENLQAQSTKTYGGLTVAHFRMPARPNKVLLRPVGKKVITDFEPTPVVDSNILRIRHSQARKTAFKTEVLTVISRKEKEKRERQKKLDSQKNQSASVPKSFLPNRYKRGELPCTVEHSVSGLYLSWACPLDNLDYEYYLPLFFDGLQCKEHPVCFIARQAIDDLLLASKGHPEWVVPNVSKLVVPLRNALAKYDKFITLGTLKAIQQLLACNEDVGKAILPYLKSILIPIASFADTNTNIGDAIDYGQRNNDDVGGQVSQIYAVVNDAVVT